MAGSGNRGHVSSEGARGSCWGIALRFTGEWSQVIHRSVDGATAQIFHGKGVVHWGQS